MPPSKNRTKLKQSFGHATISPTKVGNAPSGSVRDDQESNVTQILSQRLNNMEQQLMLLRSDLKDAIDTLKRKDQEITTLENKIALVERKKDAEKNGSPNEILSDLSEDVDPETKSRQQLLQKECDGIAQKLQEMEKFFGDYGLVWVKEDALDETDPNNLWVRKTDIHYTPDFDKIFLVVEELNVGNAEPQIVKKGNTAQFKRADLLNLTLYADGIQLENNPFRLYDSPSVEEFFRDLEDGYFPTELKGEYPEGVIFKVKDMRNTMFADDPRRRTARPVTSPRSVSPLSVPRGSTKLPPKDDGKNEFEKDSKLDACKSPRRSRTLSRKGSTSSRRSILKSTAAKSRETSLVADGKLQPQDGGTKPETSGVGGDPKASPRGGSLSGPQIRPSKVGVNDNDVSPGKDGEVPKTVSGEEGEGTKLGVAPGADVIKTKDDAADSAASTPGTKGGVAAGADVVKTKDDGADGAASSPGTKGGVAEGADVIKTKDDAADGAATSPGTGVGNGHKKSDPQVTHSSMKQLFVGRSPQVSTTRVSQPHTKDIQKIVLDKELTNDSFGLPRPPLSPSVSDRIKDPPKPTRPPSQHFDNYFLNKAEETQTSGTYVMPQAPQPQPTHITNITYNEAPITIQMTPSELKGNENKTPLNVCPSHHPHPCNCAHGPAKSTTQEEDSAIGLIRIPGETEYREKFTESAANATNVLQKKKKSHEESAKIPAQDVAPIPPDPLTMGAAFDPNVQWPNFRYLGHPKGQETVPPPPTPVTQPHSPKKEPDSRQVIQLNEKTSDRMISVNMRTKSGNQEYVAHLYPDEPAKQLISLLKMNEGDSIIVDNEEKAETVHTNVAEISSESGRRVVAPRFEDQKPKKFYPERPNLGRTNPDLFKNYPGEIEVKKKKRRKKTGEKNKVSIESVSSDSISMKTEKSEDDNESRDLVISRYKNRDWLSKEVYSRKNVPRVTSRELKIMLDTIKREDISITTVQDTTAKQFARSESDLPPKIASEDVVSVERIKAHKSNYSTRKREVLETGKNCEILPGGEKSRSSSLISERQCTTNSFAAGPRKKAVRRNIHESTSSLNIVGMDRTFPERRKIRVFAEPSGSGEQEKHRSSRVSPDTSIFSEPDKRESHSLIFKRRDSEESREVAENESLHGGLKIEFLDNTSRNSEISFCYSWTCRSRTDVNIADHSIPPKTCEGEIHHEDPNSRFADEEVLSNSIEDALSDRELLDDRGLVARRASSSGIRSDGFEAATLLEIVGAMLKAQKEYKMEKLRDMKRDGVLVRENSSDVSMSTEFIPPPDVVEELEELKRSLGSVSPVSPPPRYSEESNREFAERLLEELLSRKSSPEEIIRKLEARKDGSSIVPEAPPKHAERKRRGRVNKKPTKPRERHKEFNAYLYPEEPVKKLWSLLKLNDKEYSLTATQAPHTPLRRGSIGDHVRDNNLTLVLSKTKLNAPAGEKRGSKSSMNAQPTKVKSETSSTEGVTKMSKEPKQELSTSSKEGPTLSPGSTTKAKTELTTASKDGSNIEESILPKRRKSSSHREVEKKSGGSDHTVSSLVHPQKKPKDPETPTNRAQALSERLSQVSLSRKSFQSVSHRNSTGSVHLKPASLDGEGQSSSKENGKARGSKEFATTSPHSSISHVGDKASSPKNLLDNLESRASTSKERINSATNNELKTIQSSQSSKNLNNEASSKRSLVENFGPTSPIRRKAKKRTSKSLIVEEGEKPETRGSKEFAKTSPHSSISHVGDKVSSPKNLLDNLESRAPTSKEHINSATNNEPKTIQSSQSSKNLNNETSSKRSLVENFGPTSPIRRKAKKGTSKSLIVEEGEKPETRGSKEFAKTSPHSSISHVGDKVSSPKNLLDNLESRAPTSKEHIINSATNNEPKTIQSSQSLKNLNNETSSKRSLVENFGPTSPIRRKAKKGTSKSLIVEESEKPETQLSESPASSQALKAPTNPKIVIHRTSNPSLEQEKMADQIILSKDFNSERKSTGLKNSKENLTSVEEIKVDQKTSGTTSERKVSSNKGISTGKHDNFMTPGQDTSLTDKLMASEKDQTPNKMETDAQRRSPEHEIVTPIITEMVHSFHQDASKGGSAVDDPSKKPDGSRNGPNMPEQIHPLTDTMDRKKSMSPPKSGIAVNGDDITKPSGVHPITDVGGATFQLKEGGDSSKPRDGNPIISAEGATISMKEGGDSFKIRDFNPIISVEGVSISLKECEETATPNVHAPNAEHSSKPRDVNPINSVEGATISLKENEEVATQNVKAPNVEHISKLSDVNPIISAEGATTLPKEGGDSSKRGDVNPIISVEGATISLKEGADSSKPRDGNPIISAEGATMSLKENEEVATSTVKAPNAEHISKLGDVNPIISAEGATSSLKEGGDSSKPRDGNPIISAEGATISLKEGGDSSKARDGNPIISAEGATMSLKENEEVATSTVKAPNAEHISKLGDVIPIISAELATMSLKENEEVATPNVKAPNAEPPRIEQSDVDFTVDKEAKVSSVNHCPNREYDKHDSEQELKRETATGPPTITTAREDKEQPKENTDTNVEEKIVKPKNGTRKSGIKKKTRKSSKEENDGIEKQDDSQERKKSDGNGEKNEDLASPAISEEDNIASDNMKVQNADDVSESSLT